eukprot:gnl/TRDRNA2_/TRDRNA2_41641_c0_seq1.p1 gnl/TRDRNA2_/TRDRNA2_41641_c0~~gnl/TRDRNA2_/TRDRNA2_41641_c0_seq1.p1  ORF type:complete len:671 (-),score=95.72 gnl/TRDRNA2_/TRDRNA2_41641_c0_seq1:76-2055(-)
MAPAPAHGGVLLVASNEAAATTGTVAMPQGPRVKLFVTFSEASDAEVRFVVCVPGSDTIASLRRQIVANYHTVFPAKPPLCFFRLASGSDGFFLTEESRVSEVLDEGSTVVCHRADGEAAGAPLPEFPSREEVEDLFGKFRAQVAYITRAACHAAVRGRGTAVAAEAMSIVLAVLLLEAQPRRLDALAALQRGLLANNGAALPTFLAAGGLFVLLHLVSPSTRMDMDPSVTEAATGLLEKLLLSFGDELTPLLQDCEPSSLLVRLSQDSRCPEAARARALASLQMLEEKAAPVAPRTHGNAAVSGSRRRPLSERGSRSLRTAGGALLASEQPERPILELVVEAAACPGTEALRELAVGNARQIAASILQALRAAAAGAQAAQLKTCAGAAAALAGDMPTRRAVSRAFADLLILRSRPPRETDGAVADVLRRAWPPSPLGLRRAILTFLGDALLLATSTSDAAGTGRLAELLAALLCDVDMPEDLQAVGLTGLKAAIDPSGPRAGVAAPTVLSGEDATASRGGLSPKALNAALLRMIHRQPLLCLDVLAALALKDSYRSFLCTQTSLLQLLVHFCHQPAAVAMAAAKSQANATVSTEAGASMEPAVLQRLAAKCLANLSTHPTAREWARQSGPLYEVFSSADADLAVKTYVGVALGVEPG